MDERYESFMKESGMIEDYDKDLFNLSDTESSGDDSDSSVGDESDDDENVAGSFDLLRDSNKSSADGPKPKKQRTENRILEHANVKQDFCCTFDNCKRKFSQAKKLDAHLKMHSDTTRLYICCVCTMRFTSEKTLKSHIKEDHKGNQSIIELGSLFPQFFIFSDIPEVAAKYKDKPNTRKIMNKENVTTVKCNLCPKKMTKMGNLLIHYRADHAKTKELALFEAETLVCHVCNQRFKKIYLRDKHLKRFHQSSTFEGKKKGRNDVAHET